MNKLSTVRKQRILTKLAKYLRLTPGYKGGNFRLFNAPKKGADPAMVSTGTAGAKADAAIGRLLAKIRDTTKAAKNKVKYDYLKMGV